MPISSCFFQEPFELLDQIEGLPLGAHNAMVLPGSDDMPNCLLRWICQADQQASGRHRFELHTHVATSRQQLNFGRCQKGAEVEQALCRLPARAPAVVGDFRGHSFHPRVAMGVGEATAFKGSRQGSWLALPSKA